MTDRDWERRLAARAWVKANPSEAVKVLLETGGLEQCGWRENAEDAPYGYGSPRCLPIDEDDEDGVPPWYVPVYRLGHGDETRD